ncbi:GpE family phage tail protein [Sphingomonas morindae]|uniref:GpE family phage tail protein n=1 Tax=Sphingomonas morindae TaxID=1541170 RepID=A0ABY4X774_9SPHN|nr:GpE family phage tail protein [Sphingomonas morindae]USI72731.1 GpE family phage tail protein [Sphingomonas morindae]
MADLAVMFHWPPAALAGMSVAELMAWRRLAIDRAEALGLVDTRE